MPANTQPIYPTSVIHWITLLKTQVTPRILTTETPVLVGTAGLYGALIHQINVQPLGDNIATVMRLYTLPTGTTVYNLENELTLNATSSTNATSAIPFLAFTLPNILPSGNTGLHLGAGDSLYASLGTAVATGFNLFVRGGNY